MQEDTVLFQDENYKCIMFHFDDENHEENFLSVNQYLIVDGEDGFLIDPGCAASFDDVFDAVSRYISPKNIKYIFFSHQDPDVASSLPEWSNYTAAKIIFPAIWTRFMSHYGIIDNSRIISIPDNGMELSFNINTLHLVPAHFMHSPGQFSVYDEKSKIIFSGDIGAAVLPISEANKPIRNFSLYSEHLKKFHQRFMAGNIFCKRWVKNVRGYDVDIIAPQHGMPFEGENVDKFLSWIDDLQCGGDLF